MPKKFIKNNDEMERLAGTAREGDGVDPRQEAKIRQRARRQRSDGSTCGIHRQERFGSQVRDAIDSALLSASNPSGFSLQLRGDRTRAGASPVGEGIASTGVKSDITQTSAAIWVLGRGQPFSRDSAGP